MIKYDQDTSARTYDQVDQDTSACIVRFHPDQGYHHVPVR